MNLKRLARQLRTPIAYKVFSKPKVKHVYTNLTHEITGSYHNEKTDWFSVGVVAIIVIAVLLIIGEQTGIISKLVGTV